MNRLKEISASAGLAICFIALLSVVALSVPMWLGYDGTVQAGTTPSLAGGIARNGDTPTPTPTPLVSQGLQAHDALSWHTDGYKGAGVKVGIIDFDFKGVRALQGKELPALTSTQVRCYTSAGNYTSILSNCEDSCTTNCASFVSHGTSVAEIIIDVAPESTLYISNVARYGLPYDLKQTVAWMVRQGVDVINYSVAHPLDAPGDGTSGILFSGDHVLETIDYAVSNGVVWVNSGGNQAHKTWYGAFNDSDGDTYHAFNSSGDETNIVNVQTGQTLRVSARWGERWYGAQCNLKLELHRRTGLKHIKSSSSPQGGFPSHHPFEYIQHTVRDSADAGDYFIYLRKVGDGCSVHPSWVQLQVRGAGDLTFHTCQPAACSHQIGVPAESNNAGMLAVGAASHSSPHVIKDYSNRGPAVLPLPSSAMPNGRIKPDLAGAAGVSTKIDFPDVFEGTSAAAPHVAGLAALVIDRYDTSWGIYKPADVVNYLKETTTKQSNLTYPNNTWGQGFASLPNPAPTAHLAHPLPTIQEGASASIAIRTNLSRPEGVRVEVNNDKLAVHAGCTAAGNDRADFFAGQSVALKGCSPGRLELRLYQKGTDILLRIYDVTVTPKTSASLLAGTTAATPSSFTINQNTTFSLTTTLPATTRVDIRINNSGDAGRMAFVSSGVGGATGSSTCPGAANSQQTHSKGDSIIIRGCTEGTATIKLYQSGTTTELASYSVAVGSAATLAALPPPTGLSISAVAGSPRRLLVSYTRPLLTHRYQVELYKLELATDTWFLESAKGTGGSSINLGAGPGSWHRARGRSCKENNRNICGVWSDWSPRYEFSNPAIALSGLTGSYIAGDRDAYGVTLSDLTLDQPYTVTFLTSNSTIGYNYLCHPIPLRSFTALSQQKTLGLTLHTCQVSGETATAQSGTVTAQLRKGNARGAIVATAIATVTVAKATGSLSAVPSTITVGHDRTLTLTTNVPNSTGVWVSATVSGDSGQLTLPPTRGCYYAISGLAAVNGNTLTLRGCKVGTARLTLYRNHSAIQLASYTVTVTASNTQLSPEPTRFTAGHDQTFTLTTDIADDPGVWITATVAGDPGQLTLPPTRGCYHATAGLAAVNGNTITIRGCQAGRATIKVGRANSGVFLKTYTVTVVASNTSLSPEPATFTAGHDQTFTLTTDIANDPGVWITATVAGDSGRLTLPPTRGCYHSVSGLAAVNGNTITIRGCQAGTATIKVGRANSGVFLKTYTVTVVASNTNLSPAPATFTIGTNQTFTVTTDIPNNPGLWVGLNYAGDIGRLAMSDQSCTVASGGTAAVNGNAITLKPCRAGAVTIKVGRANSGVFLVTYEVTVNSS